MKPIRLVVRAFGPFAGEQVLDFADLRGESFFLIHGPTGAGKTSILDAMCFALYGESAGGSRQPRQLRSDHADPATPTEVRFDFSLGSARYRIERSPEYERPKKRGQGVMRQSPKATLWQLDGESAAGSAPVPSPLYSGERGRVRGDGECADGANEANGANGSNDATGANCASGPSPQPSPPGTGEREDADRANGVDGVDCASGPSPQPSPPGTGEREEGARANREASNKSGDSPFRVLATGWAAVNEAVERLMGFKVDQFRQVVMLPQGQFQKLLTSPSNERQQILEALFQVHDYGRIEQALKEAAGDVKTRIEAARQSRLEVLAAAAVASVEELEQAKAATETELAAAREQAAALRAARQAALDALAAARRDAERLAARDAAVAELRRWEGKQEEFALKETGYQRSCKAAPLVEIESDVKRRRAETEELRKRHEAASRALQNAIEQNAHAQKALEQQQAFEPEREQARRRVAELEAFTQKVKELSEAESKVRIAESAVAARTREQTRAAQQSQIAKAAAVSAAEALKSLEAISASAATLTLELKAANDALANRKRLAEHVKHADEAQRRLAAARKKLATAQRQLDLGRQNLAALQTAWLNAQAAVLARGLADGEPCPVCGSAHHPNPAAPDANHHVPEQAEVDEERARVEKLNEDCQSLREEQVRSEAELSAARASIALVENALGERAALGVDVFEHDAQHVAKKLQDAEGAGIEAETKKERLILLQQREETATTALTSADAGLAQAQADLKAAHAIAAERQAGVPESLRSLEALDRAHGAAIARVRELAAALDTARDAAQKATAAHAAAVASESAAKQSADTAFEHAEARRLEFVAKVKEAGFADYPAFVAARLSPEQLEALNEEIRAFHIALQSARRNAEEKRRDAEGIAAPDLASVATAAQAAEQAVEQNVRQEEILAQRLRQADAALARLRALDADLATLEQQYQLVGQIADVANGRNDYRMTFQRYVLGVFLDEVLHAATLRLRIMSRNRYVLQRVTDPATGRSAGGLDLEVYDEWTGTTRPTSTLSGGEGFSASLALALGLADVVQAHAGGIRLDTMFIDEGFGTLDPEALDLAIRALRDLQQGGRLVGIISHVTELKEWIDARLEVGLGRRGSTARFVVGG